MIELFRSSRSHLAVVLGSDEAMAGIITFEDALEEIVGEIRDELDIEKGPIFEHTENSIVVDGSLSMRELRAETGWNFEFPVKEDVERWILRNLGNCPRQNEEARIGEYLITSLHTHATGLRRARLTRLSPEELQTMEDLEKEKAEEEA